MVVNGLLDPLSCRLANSCCAIPIDIQIMSYHASPIGAVAELADRKFVTRSLLREGDTK